MSVTDKLISLGTKINAAKTHCNEALVAKGGTEASTLWEVGDRIGEITVGGTDRDILISLIGGHLEEIEIPDGTNGITSHIFRGNGLIKNVIVPESVSGIGDYAFYECHFLENINLGNNYLSGIGKYAFYDCYKLTSFTIPYYTTVGNNAFDHCRGLVSVTFIGGSKISSRCFNLCTSLETLILRGNSIHELSSVDGLSGTPIQNGTGYIYVPRALLSEYQSATNWSTFSAQFRAIEDYPNTVGG